MSRRKGGKPPARDPAGSADLFQDDPRSRFSPPSDAPGRENAPRSPDRMQPRRGPQPDAPSSRDRASVSGSFEAPSVPDPGPRRGSGPRPPKLHEVPPGLGLVAIADDDLLVGDRALVRTGGVASTYVWRAGEFGSYWALEEGEVVSAQ